MSRLREDLEEMELAAGDAPAAAAAEMGRKADAGRNGDDGDLGLMYHFARDFLEWPDES
jgi:hypothetical protein